MGKTVWSEDRFRFSLRGHQLAQKLIYPRVFPGGRVVSTIGTEEDYLQDWDARVEWTVYGAVVSVAVSERWRKPEFSRFKDLTFTLIDYAAGGVQPGLFTSTSDYIIYGYHDGQEILEAWVIATAEVKRLWASGRVKFSVKKQQKERRKFVAIPIPLLVANGCCIFYYRRQQQQNVQPKPLRRAA